MPETTAATAPARPNPLGTQPIGKLLLRFSIPAVISMLVNAIYNMVDQIFIGQYIGVIAMAATNVAFPLSTICTAVSLLLGVGGAANFNLRLGEGKKKDAASIAGNTITLLAVSGIVLGAIVLIFAQPLLYAFGATSDSIIYALPYTIIFALGIPFTVFSVGATNLIRADGAPTYSMICVLAGAVFNLIFDPVFLLVFGMGIEGIALATTLGQVLSFILCVIYLARRFHSVKLEKPAFKPRARFAKMICALGMASCFNQLALTAVQIALNNTLRHYGALSIYGPDIPIAAVGAVSKINIIFIALVVGVAQGCQPIIGYNYGAKLYGRVKKTYINALWAACIISVLCFACFQLFPEQIISIFGPGSDEYFRFATSFMRIYMFMTFINGIQPLTSNLFTAIGKARMGVFMSLTRQFLFLLPLILLLPLAFGIEGVLYSAPIADGAAAVLSIIFVVREMRLITRQQRLQEAGQPALAAQEA